jgi:hypothetical protein
MKIGVIVVALLTPIALILLSLGVAFSGGWNSTYSSGERSGVVDKISYKGTFNKSYEGELKMSGFSKDADGNMVQNVFKFSVVDPVVAQKLKLYTKERKAVSLSYNQWGIKPILKQDTPYTVMDVTPVV